MSKRILVTSTDLMMVQFLVPHIVNLAAHGYEVEIACSDVGGRIEEIRSRLKGSIKAFHVVRLHRSPVSPGNFKGYGDMKKVINEGHYDIIWTNEPVMGVVTRLAAKKSRKNGTKVLYMTHGFHFYDGAPKLNWMIYYPIEKLMASKADMIATINHEDYRRAKTMKCSRVEYIHGIGMNTDRLKQKENQKNIREELQIPRDSFLVLSVGELNENKNQQTIIRAISILHDAKVHYILCGKGDQFPALEKMASDLGLEQNVHFLGYRKDVVDICSQSDVFVMPSRREGLGLAALEAMYCGLPLITSRTRGFEDFMEEGKTGYLCDSEDADAFAGKIRKLKEDAELCNQMGEHNREVVKPFCLEHSKTEVLNIIESL